MAAGSTMELALKLGAVRFRKMDTGAGKARASLQVLNLLIFISCSFFLQNLTHLLVLDFESTCWKGRENAPPPEIIEFPVLLLCLSSVK